MKLPVSLRTKIIIVVTALTLICVGGGVTTLWFIYTIDNFFNKIINQDLAATEAAEEVAASLIMQKGYLTYYFQDGNPAWLAELKTRERDFRTWLGKIKKLAGIQSDFEIINEIQEGYANLSALKKTVVAHYKKGEREEGLRLHQKAREAFFHIRDLAERLKHSRRLEMERAWNEFKSREKRLSELAVIAVGGAVFLGALLVCMLIIQVLGPIKRLAEATMHDNEAGLKLDEVEALSHGVHNLMEDVDATKSQLETSREHLIQASKLASVGKLAAGVAHSIRNPLTSVKLRLFSLERSLKLSPLQSEDFEVISGEIRRLDHIVRNFLEFSRPPVLDLRRISPSEVIDSVVTLLSHRLESSRVEAEVVRTGALPEIDVDPEQLKEVLVNLVVNACDAVNGQREGADASALFSKVVIKEWVEESEPLGRVVMISVCDQGPGVPGECVEKLFHPFFTTKDDGVGLGLNIAQRIIEEHGGEIEYRPGEHGGACFVLTLPVRDDAVPPEWEPPA